MTGFVPQHPVITNFGYLKVRSYRKYDLLVQSKHQAIQENKINILLGNHTLELAKYELGNILWKNDHLQAKATQEEIVALTKNHKIKIKPLKLKIFEI